MASAPTLDIDALMAPIPGDDPAGAPLAFDVRKKLDDARKEVDPSMFARNDPRRPEQPKEADWSGIIETAQETLTGKSKDLLVAARLTEALVKKHGFAGLRDGVRVLRRMLQDCWERMHPSIQDGDLDARSGPFDWLDDELRGSRLPFALRKISLLPGQNFSYHYWKDAQEAKGGLSVEAFNQTVVATKREACQLVVDDLGECQVELQELAKVLGDKLGAAAPGMSQVRKAILDCLELAQQILHRKGPAPVAAPAVAAAAAKTAKTPGAEEPVMDPEMSRRPLTREDVLSRLADASAQLLQMEPHSPVAYLVQRAVRLAALPLPDLMRVLIRDPGVLGQLDRDLDLGLDKQDKAAKPK